MGRILQPKNTEVNSPQSLSDAEPKPTDGNTKISTDQDSQTIRRVGRYKNGFVTIDNRTAQDKQISWEARGLLVYLLSLPLDWQIKVNHLIGQGNAGRDAVRKMLRELQAFGYASGFHKPDEHALRGRFGGSEIVVYESPDLNPFFLANSPTPEKPSSVAQAPESPTPDPPTPDPPTPEKPSAYKVNNLQTTDLQNTHTQHLRAGDTPAGSVCVTDESSEEKRPSREQFEQYARNNRDRQGALLGEGWIRTAIRTGEYDALVLRWITETESGAAVERSFPTIEACQDCDSAGFTHKSLLAGAARKCTHPKLSEGAPIVQSPAMSEVGR
jgi:hypothetical protein